MQLWAETSLNSLFCSRRTNKALADSLDRAVDPQDQLVNRLLRIMATQAMSQALYFSTGAEPQDQYYHYGNLDVVYPAFISFSSEDEQRMNCADFSVS